MLTLFLLHDAIYCMILLVQRVVEETVMVHRLSMFIQVRKATKRERFEMLLEEEGFLLEREKIGKTMYCMLHCTFPRLCKEAEGVKLQMPLKNVSFSQNA